MLGSSVWELVGDTPLIRLGGIARDLPPDVEIHAKAEWFNPGGSVKDRAALSMILEGERTGKLTSDKILLDASSGNTGVAYAMLGSARGYRVKLCIPRNVSRELLNILRSYGAELILTDPGEGSDGAIRKVREVYAEAPDRYFYPDQYSNPANWQAHYRTTAVEIWEQTQGRITHFVAGLGTSGTFMGTSRRLKEFNPDIEVCAVQPDSPFHGLEGLKHMETAIVPEIYDPKLVDRHLAATTEDAQEMVVQLARQEGLLIGLSSGAALIAARELAKRLTSGVVVTVFPDGGFRYLGETFWEEI